MPRNVQSSVRRVRVFLVNLVAAGLLCAGHASFPQSSPAPELVPFPGGLMETATTGLVRPLLSASVLQALLPSRGAFVFPPPYSTQGVRLTNASDCGGGDCVDAVGYSYWRNINNHTASDDMLIILGLNRARGGPGPSLFRYNKVTDQVTNLGPLFPATHAKSYHSAEGWYFSGTQPTKIYLDEGSRMLRYDVLTKQSTVVFDVAPRYGADKIVWQMHSSDDDKVHSVTLRTLPSYEMLGCLVYHEDTAQFQYFPKIGEFNECHVDKSGRWLLSLEDVDGLYDLEMRIFDLQTGTERLVMDQAGAVGHADMGFGYMIGDDNWNSRANAMMVWDFAQNPLSGRLVSYNLDWSAPAPNHTSHGNARPGVPASDQYACGSSASRANAIWGNEIICFRMDGSLNVLVVAPVMTDLNAPGGGSDDYVKKPKGNLDVTGQYFIWTSNAGGNRLDAFLVKVPGQRLLGSLDTTSPTVSLTAPVAGASVSGTTTVTATAADNVGVLGVQFRLDGANLGSEDTTAPYAISWNTAGASNGSHSLVAIARDAAGNTGASVPVGITVANGDTTPPSISAVLASGITASGAAMTWTTNEASDNQVEYGPTSAYGSSTALNVSLVVAHAAALTGLAPATTYHFRVKSRDASGNLAVSGDFNFLTLPQPPSGSGPIGSWPLSEGSGGLTADASGNGFNGSLSGSPAWIAGRVGPGLLLDGVDDYVAVPHAPWLNPFPLTVTTWVRTTATGLHGIINKYLPGSFNGYQIFTNGGNLCAWYFRDAANFVWDATSCTLAAPGYNDGQWHHVALVVDAAGGRLYVDGAQKSSRAWTGTAGAVSTTAELALGRYPSTATPYFPGALDEVRAYNRALSAAEITGLIGLDTTPPILSSVSASGLSDTGATIAWTTNELADTQVEYGPTTGYGSSSSLNGSLLTSHSQGLAGLASSTLYHYRVKSRDASGNLAVSADFTFTSLADTSGGGKHKGRPLAFWTFSETGGALAADSSGNGFDGTLMGGPVRTAGPIGQGLSFDGVDDSVAVAHAPALDPYPVTVATWIRTGATGLHGVVNKYLPGSRNGYQIFMSGGRLCAWYFRDASEFVWDGTGCTLAVPGYSDGRWHHVAFVVDSSGGRLFVDGGQKAARAWTGAPGAATTAAALSLGSYPGTLTPYLPGALDDVRIYDRALGADEVMALFNPGVGLLGSWSFSETGGATAADFSGFSFNGTILGGPARIAGPAGAALSFDGVDDSVEVPHAPPLDPLPLTVAAWVRTGATGLRGVINKYAPSSFNGYQVFVSGGSLCAWYFRDAGNFVWDGSDCGLSAAWPADGAWHHVAFVVDGWGGRLYVDGEEKAARAWTGTAGPATTTAGLAFARYQGLASSWLPGDLDEVRVYGRALSEDQIADLREGALPVL